MKYILAFILITSPIFIFAQKPLVYTEVVPVDSATKNLLFIAAQKWVAESYKSANDVIQMQDKEAGEIVGKGAITFYPKAFMGSATVKGFIHYTFTISVKDGRYKYSFNNFYHKGTSSGTYSAVDFDELTDAELPPNKKTGRMGKKWFINTYAEMKSQVDIEMKLTIESLKKAMNSKKQEDNW